MRHLNGEDGTTPTSTRSININPRPLWNDTRETNNNGHLTQAIHNTNLFNNNSVNTYSNYSYQNNCTLPLLSNVKIMGLNVCGIRSKLNNNIFESVVKELGIEILCLSETKTDHIDLTGTKFNGEYTCFTKEKTEYRYGGVHGLAMIIKDNIAAHTQLLTDTNMYSG